MRQILTNFLHLPTWYCSHIFLCHVAFWVDLREFKVEIFNFKQASLFFSEKLSDLSLNAFLVDVWNFFMKKRAEFSENRAQFLLRRSIFKILVCQHTLIFDVFSMFRVQLANPVWTNFFKISVRNTDWYPLTYAAIVTNTNFKKRINK